MSTIKIRNLPLATNEQVKPGNFLACALDTNSGLQKLTRKLTLSQVVSGGLQDGIVPIPIASLPIATTNSLGVVKIGANLNITPGGILSVDTAGIVGGLPIAKTTSLGVVEIGANLNITPEGILSADNPTAPYQLPTASATVLGGIKVGANLTIDSNGTLNATAPSGGGGAAGTPNWSSGWVNTDGTTAVANGASLTFTHNLNSTDLVFNVYAARDSNGTGAVDVSNHEVSQTDIPRSDYGSIVSLTNSNQINILLASQGLLLPDPGALYNVTNSAYGGADYTHIKVVASASGGGANISKYSTGLIFAQNNRSIIVNHNLNTSDYVVQVWVFSPAVSTGYEELLNTSSSADYFIYNFNSTTSFRLILGPHYGDTNRPYNGTQIKVVVIG